MLRYMHRLEARDLSLTTSMIPLGSCTMKLNATSEMLPVTWPEFGRIHPFAPADQTAATPSCSTARDLAGEITGLPAVSLQPNAGLAGRVRGAARDPRATTQLARRERARRLPDPVSAHGTNPASA